MFILQVHISTAVQTSTGVSIIARLMLNMHQQQQHQHVTPAAHAQPSTRVILAVLQVDDLLRGVLRDCCTQEPGGALQLQPFHRRARRAASFPRRRRTSPPPPMDGAAPTAAAAALPSPIRPPGARQLKVRIFVDIIATRWVSSATELHLLNSRMTAVLDAGGDWVSVAAVAYYANECAWGHASPMRRIA